jgi:hypothetical protein
MMDSPHKLATVVTFNHKKKAVVSCHTRMLGRDGGRLENPWPVEVGVAYAKPSLDISYSDDHFLVLVTFAVYNCFQICTDEAPI